MQKKILLMLSVLLVMITSVAYSALSTSLSITSEVKFRVLADIRVNSVTFVSASGAEIGYESEYSKNTVSNGFTLPTSGSSISYRVHIDNAGDVDYSIYDILKTTSNSGLNVAVSGYNMRDVIPAKTSVDLVLTYTTSSPSENIINVVNTFDFKRVFYVTYETGTSTTIPQQIKYQGVNLALTNTQPTKNGYTFSKWNTKSDGSGVNYNSGASYTVDDDVTLYARYDLATYNINYVLNGGTNNANNPSTYTIESNNITLADATKTGYTFKGWTGNGTTTPTKNLVLPKGSYGDKTFTANFIDETDPEITVTSQDGTVNYLENAQTIDAAFGSSNGTIAYKINATDEGSGIDTIEYAITNSSTAPTTGWSSTTNGNHSDSKARGTYYLHVKATDQDGNEKVVTTKLITIRFRVAYYDYFNASTTVSENQYYTGTALTSRTPSAHSGYSFDGWYNSSALTTKTVNANTSYTPTTSIQLYGKWTPVNYNITYSMNNGTNNSNNPDSYNIESENITLAAPSKTLTFKGNYNATSGANAANGTVTIGSNTTKAQTFAGWTGSNGTTAQTSVTIPTGSTGDKSYTAHWTAVAGTVPTVTREGYTCGWSTSSTGTTIEVTSGGTFPTSSITEGMSSTVNLYAVCNPNTYTVTANANGGSISSTTGWTGTGNTSTKQVTYDSTYGTLPTATRTGYTFAGWTNQNRIMGEILGYGKVLRVSNTAHGYTDPDYVFNENEKIVFDVTLPNNTINNVDVNDVYADVNSYTISGNRVYGTIAVTQAMRNKFYPTYRYKFVDINAEQDIENYTINKFMVLTETDTKMQIASVHDLYALWSINNPATPTITGGATKIFGSSATTLTCSTSTNYASGTTKYYSFGYATSDGGTPSNWTTPTTANTLTIGAQEYVQQRWYSCRVYATDGTQTTSTVASATSADTEMTINNATLTFNKGNCASTTGTTTLYTYNGSANVYTGIRETTTTGTIPTASKTGYTFQGWYDANSNGNKVLNANGSFTGTAVTNYTNTNSWSTTANQTLYARCTPNNYTVTANANGGNIPSTSGWTGTGATSTKSVTYDSTYGTLPTPTRAGYDFAGWFSNKERDIVIPANATQNYNYKELVSKVYPGVTYTVKIQSATVITGTATKFTILIHDHTDNQSYLVTNVDFGNNITKEFTVPTNLISSHDIRLLIYSGVAGQTSGLGTKYSNITISTNNGNAYEGTSINLTPGNDTIYAHWTPATYTVTAKANGGTIPSTSGWTGTGNTSTKSVTYLSTYGTLPTPTRTGYTFAGWNGKNLLNYNDFSNYNNWSETLITNGEFPTYASNPGFVLNLESGKTYTISYTTSGTSSGEFPYYFYLCKIDNNEGKLVTYLTTNVIEKTNYTFTVEEGESYFLRIAASSSNFNSRINTITSIQLEVGTTATTWEPYYITSSTQVTTPGNHDINARWIRDGYTITYSMNNGVNGNNPTAYNIESPAITLAAPSKTLTFVGHYNATSGANASSTTNVQIGSNTTKAQTFAGWTGSNGSTAQTTVTIPTGSTGDKSYTAHWTAVAGTVPTVTRTGYTCGWSTSSSGTTIEIASGGSYATSRITEGMSATVNLYAVCVDDIAPTIVSATPSTVLDLRNYIEFNATDAGTGVSGYNITTTNTAPTTWIPVVNAVETTTETKYEYNAAWARVFHHNNHWGSVYFSKENSSAEAKSSNTNDKYSVLGNIANYKNSSNWEFLLQYPDVSSTQYNRWTQTKNPITTSSVDGGNNEAGYSKIHADWEQNEWKGITLSANPGATYMDGSPDHWSWWYALGTYAPYDGGMPGPNNAIASSVNLWSRIDNLSTTTSANLTRKVGDIAADGAYYLWVKDAAGNTSSQQVTINKVDTTKPTATITSTNNVATSQTVTLTLGDNKALDKYYWSTAAVSTNPTFTTIANNPIASTQTTTINSDGTYYLSVVDKAGNRYYVAKNFYKTTLNANGGSVSPAYVITMEGNSYTLPNPTRTGYDFAGWYTDSGLTTAVTLTSGKYKPTATGTLYAKWTPASYTVTAKANGGSISSTSGWSGTGNTATKSVTYLSTYGTLPTPTRSGYTFTGWNGKNLLNINVLESLPSSTNGTNTESRTFVPNTYVKGLAFNNYYYPSQLKSLTIGQNSITFNAQSGYGIAFPIISDGNKTYTLSFDSNGTANRGCSLLYYEEDGTLISFNTSSMSSHTTKTFTTPTNTYYLVIEFYGAEESENIVLSNIQLEEGSDATTYEPYYITSNTQVTIPANHDINARWTRNDYSITYALNNGTVSTANPTTYHVESSAITLNNPTKSLTFKGNYNATSGANAASGQVTIGSNTTQAQTFAGWSGTGLSNNTVNVTIPTGSTGNRSYTAHWTAVAGTVPTVTRTGYTCGWSTSSTGTTIEIASGGSYATSRITEGMSTTVNLYAVCTPNTYKITYDYNTTNYRVSGQRYIDTGYKVNWDNNFELSSTINYPSSHRYLLFGNFNSSKELNLELTAADKLRVYSSGDIAVSTDTVSSNTDISFSFMYTAGNNNLTLTSTGTNSNATASGTKVMSGLAEQSLRIGTDNREDYTFGEYTLKSASITDYYVYGGTVNNLPTASTKPGYTFNGWYTAATGGTQVTSSTSVPAVNTTYYAHWTPVGYSINYALNNGTVATANPTSYNIESTAITLNNPTKTLTFKGNYNATSGANAASGQVTIGSNTTQAQTFAGWSGTGLSGNTVNVTLPSGSIGDRSYIAHWTAVAATLPTVTRTGYTCGWNTSSTGTTIQYASGGTYPTTAITEGMSTTVNLYAVCNPNTYQLTINPQGGTYNSTTSNSTKTMTYDASTNNDIGVPTRDGYTFDGWYIEANSKTNQLFNNTGKNTALSGYFSAAYSTGVWKKTSPVTVYAHWSKAVSSTTNSVSPTTYIYDGTAKSPTETVKDGSTTLTNGTDYTISYSNNTNVGTATATITGKNVYNATTKAYYTGTATVNYYINNATLTFDKGSCASTSGTTTLYTYKGATKVYTGIRDTTTTGTIPTASKSGYTFQGWYTASSGGSKVLNANGTFSGTAVTNYTNANSWQTVANQTLYAQCSKDSYSITYSMNNGTNNSNNPSTYTVESAAITLAAPSKTLTFKGNYNSTSGTNAASGQVTIGSNTTKAQTFAGWTGSNGSTAQTSVTIAAGSTGNKSYTAHWTAVAGTTPTVTRTGYTCGWSTSSTGTTIEIASGGSYATSRITEGMAVTVNLYAVCVDNIAPTIVSTTPTTTLDLRNYVDFNATDAGTGVSGYNITSTNTAPTTWIPVVNAVAANTETKYFGSAAWARVFHQNNHWGEQYFANKTEAKSSSTIDKYSVLDNIANYKANNKWELLLEYPELSASQYNRWTQTANPVTDGQDNGSTVTPVAGYTSIHTDWGSFGGLEASTSSSTLMDGNTGHGNWCYAIGVISRYLGGMPGNCSPTSTANLWARIDNLSTTTSANLTRRIGDIAADGTYYVWVKDAAGNTNSTSITINKVDTTKPTATITSTNNVATSQTATLTLGDNKAISKYYFGSINLPNEHNPTYTTVSNTPTSSTQTSTVSSEGTYYLSVVDGAGNRYYVSKNFYKTTFNANSGSVSPANVITMSGNSFTLPTPTRTGYDFAGWYTDSGLTTAVTLTSGKYAPNASATLYAKWTPASYTLTANANGGSIPSTSGWSGTGNTSTKSVTYLSTYGTLPTPTRSGYTFSGWTSDNIFENGDTLSGISTVGTKDETVKYNGSTSVKTDRAWQGIYLNLKKLYDEGKISIGDKLTFSIYYKTDFTLTKNTTFTLYRAYDSYARINVTVADAVPNQWHRLVYTITVDSTSIASTNARIEADYYEQSDYTFAGNIWFAAPQIEIGESATGYTPYYVTSGLTVEKTSNHTIKANWTRNNYSITYTLNNGTVSTANPTTYHVESSAITLNNPTKTLTFKGNYNTTSGANAASGQVTIGSNTTRAQTFAGWTGSNGNTAQTTVTIPSGSTGDKSYTAHWTAVAGTVPTVTRNGYTCGWNRSSSGTTIEIASGGTFPTSYISEGMASTVNLYAVCTPNKIHLTLDPSPGTGGTTDIWYYYGTSRFYSNAACTTEISAITRPTRTGYTIVNYHGDGTSGGTNGERYIAYDNVEFASDLATDIYKDATMYASWAINNYDVTFDNNYLKDDIYTDTSRISRYTPNSAAGTTKAEVEDTDAANGYHVEFTMPDAGAWSGVYYGGNPKLTSGTTYTWSVEVKVSKNININIGHEQGGTKVVNLTTSWQRFTHTFTANDSNYTAFIFYAPSGTTWSAGDKLYVRNLYLEEGTGSQNFSTSSKQYNSQLGTLPTVTRPGYTFEGWFTDPVGGTEISSTTTVPANNVAYYAHWTPNKYYLDLNGRLDGTGVGYIRPHGTADIYINGVQVSNDVSDYYSQSYTGSTYEVKDIKANAGYTYNGVYSGTLTGTIGSAQSTVVLQFSTNTYQITYGLNNGTLATANPSTYTVRSEDITLNNPTKTLTFKGNYNATSGANAASGQVTIGSNTTQAQTFAGWSGTGLSGNQTAVTIATGSTGDRSYTAHWTAVAGTLPTVTRTGYTCGWSTSSSGTTIQYASGGTFPTSAISESMGTTVNLYAVCTPNTYTIGYTMNGGPNPSTKPASGTYDADVNISNPASKTFTVNINANGQGATIKNASGTVVTSATATQTFAGWTSTTMGSNAKTGTGANPSTAWNGSSTKNTYFKNLRESGTVTMVANWNAANATLPNITKTGYTCGYATSDTGSIVYNSGASYATSTTGSSVTLYAKCNINSYTLTINPNGGTYNSTTSNTTVTQNYGTTYNVANNPTKAGYVFGGWKLTSGNGNITYFQDAEKVKQYVINSSSATKPDVYNNNGNGAVTHTIISDSTSSTGYSLKITTNGTANPEAGGFINNNLAVSGAIYYHKIVAKVPTGYSLKIATNMTGVGYGTYWVTDNSGTGNWKTYIYAQYAGYNGPFSSFGHVYASGSNNTSVTWYINESTMYRKGANLTETQASNIIFGFADSNATLTAEWNPSGVRVTWDTQNGTFADSSYWNEWRSTYRYTFGYTATKAAPYYISGSEYDISRSGYTFLGWYTSANGGTQVFDSTGKLNASVSGYSDANRIWQKYDANVTLYAHWSKAVSSTTNSVSPTSYIYDGGAKSPTPTVKDGSTTLTAGTDYTVSGNSNTNVGTYSVTISGANVYNSTTKAYYTGSTTLTYYINNATLTFDKGSCTSTSGTTTLYTRKNATAVYTGIRETTTTGTIPTASKSGYTFNGWYTASSGGSKVLNANGTFTGTAVTNYTNTNSWNVTANQTLYAQCGRDSYSITYSMNNGTNNSNNPSTYTVDSSAITLAAPSKTLTFKGNANATSGANAASGTVSIGSNTAAAQTFAGWTGSNGSTAQTNVTIPSGSTGDKSYTAHWTAVAGATPTVTRTGYTCGWNRSSTGTTIEIASGGNFPTSYISEGMSSTVNLYAVCTPNTYTIGYTMNGGPNPSTKPTSGTYDANVQISNPGNKTVTVTGNANNSGATVGSATSGTQTFTGWTSTTLGSNAKTGSSTSNYAAWTGTSTKNTYFKNLRESGTVTMVANWSGTVTLPTLSRAGYTCKWYTEATGGSEMGGSGATWTIPSASSTAVTAYARCTINSYTLTINPNGGTYNSTTSNTTVTQNYGTTYSVLNNPTKAGYIFTGWTKSGSGSYNYFDTSSTATTTTTVNYDAANSALPTVYNNNGNGTVTRSMAADSTATGGYSMKIVTNGSANPGTGGVVLSIYPTTPGRINVLEVKAKIPSGYSLNGVYGLHYKGIGHVMRTDSQTGTGDWKTYYLVHYFGDTGTFSSNAWLYLSGSNNTSVTWYIDSITMRSFTKAQFKSKYTFGDGNGTLTANWSASGSRVTFNTNGGSWNTTYVANWNGNNYYDVSTTTANRYYIYANSYGTHPGSTSYDWTPDSRVISKTGNTFAGWYTAETGGTQVFDADGKLKASVSGYSDANSKWTKYDSNVTLYARWSPVNHTVTYNTTENGGTGTVASQTVGYGSSVPLPTTGASKSGWTFVGWNTDKNATSALSSLTMGLDNVTLYAIYRKEAVTLTANWNANGATLSSTAQSSCQLAAVYNNNTQATSCQVTAPTITRANYNIIGFNTTSTATTNNSSYNTSTGKLTLTSSNTGSTWYAITQAQPQLTATFAANNGATVASTSASCYVVGSNTSCQVTAPSVTPQSGFSHIGFNTTTSATSNSSSYNAGTNKLTISANGTWYPITRAQFTGTFTIQDSNAATQSGGTPSCYKYNGPGSCNIVAPTLTAKSGYTVLGWNTNQNATSASYASGATISISGNTQFYSITKASTAITITFNRNTANSKATSQTPSGGTASTDTTVTASCEKVNGATSCSVTSPTMAVTAGYHAVGYNTSATATSSSWNVNTAKSVSANATYYAITAPNTYSIKFNANCPTGTTASGTMSDLSMTYGAAKNLTANAFGCTNREFVGWSTEANGTVAYNNQASVNNLTTTNGGTFNLYAKWRLVTPPLPTASGGTTRVYGSAGDVILTCNDNINMSSYPSGAVKYYSFGYSTTSNGNLGSWSTDQQSNTYSVPTSYIGTRYYACKVYVSTSTEASDVTIGTTRTSLTVRNAKITFDANGCGTITGTNPAYVKKGIANIFTGETNETNGTMPYTSATGKTFTGWYSGSTQVINASKVVNASVSGWTDSQKKWLITEDKTLTAGCSNDPYTIGYTMNGGTNNSNNPSTYTVASPSITLAAPTKVLTFHGNTNGVNNVSIGNDTTKAQTFAGWTGSNGTTAQTTVTIASGSTGNKSYTAHWTAAAGTVPTVTKSGYTCGWNRSSSGTTIEIASGGTFPTSYISESMNATVNLYAVCNQDSYTITASPNGGSIATLNGWTASGNNATKLIASGGTYGTLPTVTAPTGKVFVGWYTQASGGTQITSSTQLVSNSSHSIYAHYADVWAENIGYSRTFGNVVCSDAQCAIDQLWAMLSQY